MAWKDIPVLTAFCEHHPLALCSLCRPHFRGVIHGAVLQHTLRLALDKYKTDYFSNAPIWYREIMQ